MVSCTLNRPVSAGIFNNRFGLQPRTLIVEDSTLRDGEQMPGAALLPDEKVLIAKALARIGVDAIEVGFPAAAPEQVEATRKIVQALPYQKLIVFARTLKKDIDVAITALEGASNPRVELVGKSSDSHVERLMDGKGHATLHDKQQANLALIEDTVRYAAGRMRDQGWKSDVTFICEDATRSDKDYLCRVFAAAIKGGASAIVVADTVGQSLPGQYKDLLTYVMLHTPGGKTVDWGTHTHNDLGLAVANTLAGVEAGVQRVQVSLLGIGERTGNASLEQVAVALKRHGEALGDVETHLDLTQLMPAAQLLSQIIRMPIPLNAPIIGPNAFRSGAGMHINYIVGHERQGGNPDTYHPFPASWVGREYSIYNGPHAGWAATEHYLRQAGLPVPDSPEVRSQMLSAVKAQSYETKREVGPDDLADLLQAHPQWSNVPSPESPLASSGKLNSNA